MFWTWPVLFLGQPFVALTFAEMSSHYPAAGSVYKWTKYVSGRGYSWITGWLYMFAGIITVAAVCATLPLALIPFFNAIGIEMEATVANQRWIAIITLVLVTLLNIYGIRLVSIVNNTGVLFEVLGLVVLAVILAVTHNEQGLGVIFDSAGQTVNASTFLIAMFMSLFVVYGFDTAGTLAEETRNPRAEAPKAVLGSLLGAFVIGAVFLWGTLMAIPDLQGAAEGLATSPAVVIEGAFGVESAFTAIYLFVLSAAIFVCCMAIMTSTVRLAFGMARDDQLPVSKPLAKVSPRWHTPIGSCVAVGLLSAIPFLQFTGATTVAVAATAMIYLSYLLGNLAIFRARLRGWPKTPAPFKLGGWAKPINVIAILWGALMLVNFLWPSPGDSAFSEDATLRILSNPSAVQTDYYVEGEQLVDFKIDFLNQIPVIELIIAVVLLVGGIYYFAAQARKPFVPVIPPEEEVPVA